MSFLRKFTWTLLHAPPHPNPPHPPDVYKTPRPSKGRGPTILLFNYVFSANRKSLEGREILRLSTFWPFEGVKSSGKCFACRWGLSHDWRSTLWMLARIIMVGVLTQLWVIPRAIPWEGSAWLNLRDLPSHFGSHFRLKTGTLVRWVCNGASCRVGEYVQRLMKHT